MTTSDSPVEWVPDACTLPTAEQPLRVAEFDRFFAESVTGVQRRARTRLELHLADGAEPTARDLAERESACCSFFTFTFTRRATMRIEVPAAHIDVLDALAARVENATRRREIAELTAARETLRAALAAGCDDLIERSESPACPLPFPT